MKMLTQPTWDTAKDILKGKLIDISAFTLQYQIVYLKILQNKQKPSTKPTNRMK